MLGGINDIAERANELFIAGEGLSQAGTELLGAQLANMTIGDIEAMLHANKVDPFLIRQLFLDFIELARALVSFLKPLSNNFLFKNPKEDDMSLKRSRYKGENVASCVLSMLSSCKDLTIFTLLEF